MFVDQTKQAYRYIFPARVANQSTGPFMLPAARGAGHVTRIKDQKWPDVDSNQIGENSSSDTTVQYLKTLNTYLEKQT